MSRSIWPTPRARPGKPAHIVAIQSEGGTIRATERATAIARQLAAELAQAEREDCDVSELILSVKCGGSDYTSGLASNPALGRVADRLVDLGGAAVLGEVAEIMGAEHLLAARALNADTAVKLLRVINRVESEAMALGLDIRGTQPSPGNIRGGLTTIEEKSLGATHKGGERTPLTDVVGYSARITQKGLTVMDTPGLDVESVTGMVGGGAQAVVFTTGLGTPTGNPIAPVIKITGNARTATAMADNIDLDVSGVLDDRETLDAAAVRLFDEVLAVCSGRETRRQSGSASASSRSTGAIRPSDAIGYRRFRRRWQNRSNDNRCPGIADAGPRPQCGRAAADRERGARRRAARHACTRGHPRPHPRRQH